MSCHQRFSDIFKGYRKKSVARTRLKAVNNFREKLDIVLNTPVFKAATELKTINRTLLPANSSSTLCEIE